MEQFINIAAGETVAAVGHSLESCTQDIRAFSCSRPGSSGSKVVFVDTPGFDVSERTDYDVLKAIAEWLNER
jgi:GTPase Era involved in 16S rRNA processing